MTENQSARPVARHMPAIIFAATVALNGALIGMLAHQSLTSPSAAAAPPSDVDHGDQHGAPPKAPAHLPGVESAPAQPPRTGREDQPPSEINAADGALPGGVTVFDEKIPAVANLRPDLLGALRQAATDAEHDGVAFVVNSGWRSPQYQQQLFRDAVSGYGSEQEAARWVATPKTSAHVSGDAADIGPPGAAAWLSTHGDHYGLCQIYGNEPWNYELRSNAIDLCCPPPYADPTQDPRMQQ